MDELKLMRDFMFGLFSKNKGVDSARHNKSVLASLVSGLPRECSQELTPNQLYQCLMRFSESQKLRMHLEKDRIQVADTNRIHAMMQKDCYKPHIIYGQKKLKESDHTFNWTAEKKYVFLVYLDKGAMIMIRCQRRRYGLSRRWVFEPHLVTRNFA